MSALCPHCNRVAQQVSEKCLYCGKPLSDAPSGKASDEAKGHGSNGSKDRPPGALDTPAPGERPLEVVHTETEGVAGPATVSRLSPADQARRDAAPGGGFFTSPLGVVAILIVAVVMVVIAISIATEPGDEGPVAIRPAEPRDPTALIAEGMMPDETQPAPDAVATTAASTRNQAGSDALDQVVVWIDRYANQYGHYPSYLGDNLEAVAAFTDPASIDQVRARFEEGRISYSRSATSGGAEETMELTATVRGPGGQTLTRTATRSRGGDPTNPAPLR